MSDRVREDKKQFLSPDTNYAEPTNDVPSWSDSLRDGFFNDADTALTEHLKIKLGTNDQKRLYVMNEANELVPMAEEDFTSKDGRKKFIDLLYQNRIFAVPAGENSPVQLRFVKTPRSAKPDIRFVDNLDMKPKISGWKTFWNRFGFYKKEVEDYNRDKAAWEKRSAFIQPVKDQRTAEGFGDTPEDAKEKSETEIAEHKETLKDGEKKIKDSLTRIKAERDADAAEREAGEYDLSLRSFYDIYGSVPNHREEYLFPPTDENGPARSGSSYKKTYQMEEFQLLKRYDELKLEKGADGLSEELFIALAMSAASKPEIAGRARSNDASANTSHPVLRADSMSTMYTRDVGYVTEGDSHPRDNLGSFFKPVIQPGRQLAADAVQAYQAGNKEPMADIVANGLMFYARNEADTKQLGVDHAAMAHFFGSFADMMEKDAELKGLVEEKTAQYKEEAQMKRAEAQAEHERFSERFGERLETTRTIHKQLIECNEQKIKLDAMERAVKPEDKTEGRESEAYKKLLDEKRQLGTKIKELKKAYWDARDTHSDVIQKNLSMAVSKIAGDGNAVQKETAKEEILSRVSAAETLHKEIMSLEQGLEAYQDAKKKADRGEKLADYEEKQLQDLKKESDELARKKQDFEKTMQKLTNEEKMIYEERLNNTEYLHLFQLDSQYAALDVFWQNRQDMDLSKTLNALKANREAGEIRNQARKAKAALLKCAAEGTGLTEEQKEEYVTDILVAKKLDSDAVKQDNSNEKEKARVKKESYSKYSILSRPVAAFNEGEKKLNKMLTGATRDLDLQVEFITKRSSELQLSLATEEGRQALRNQVKELLPQEEKNSLFARPLKEIADVNLATLELNKQKREQKERNRQEVQTGYTEKKLSAQAEKNTKIGNPELNSGHTP